MRTSSAGQPRVTPHHGARGRGVHSDALPTSRAGGGRGMLEASGFVELATITWCTSRAARCGAVHAGCVTARLHEGAPGHAPVAGAGWKTSGPRHGAAHRRRPVDPQPAPGRADAPWCSTGDLVLLYQRWSGLGGCHGLGGRCSWVPGLWDCMLAISAQGHVCFTGFGCALAVWCVRSRSCVGF